MLSDIDAEIKSLFLVIFYGWVTGTIIGGCFVWFVDCLRNVVRGLVQKLVITMLVSEIIRSSYDLLSGDSEARNVSWRYS
jgi:hypothetical protein